MHTLKTQLQEWKLVIAALASAALCSGALYGWGRQSAGVAVNQAPEFGAHMAMGAPRWVPQLFSGHGASPKERAQTRLEAAGLALDGPSFVSAAGTGHQPLIDLFLTAGIDLNATAADGRTALLAAAAAERWPLVKQLLEKGADPNRATKAGVTPLMLVALAGQTATAEALLAHHADMDAADESGKTAAAYAIAGRHLSSLTCLLGEEAEQDLLELAWQTKDWSYIEPVLSRQAEPAAWGTEARGWLQQAIEQRDEAKARLLLGKHDGPPTPEDRAQPLLAWMVRDQQLEGFKFLLQCGADPNTAIASPVEKVFTQGITQEPVRACLVSESGMTTLMLASGLGRPAFVKALLEKGAKRSLTTPRLKLPALTFAAEANEAECLQLLIGDGPTREQMRIEISLARQRATIFRDGQSYISTQISTGRPGFATPSGDFVITDKHLTHKSTIYKAEMPFFMRLNCRDFGMHEGVVPGHPASHGCIRLPGEMARRLFKEVPVGTLVSIRE